MKTSPWFIVAIAAFFVFGELVLAISLFRLQILNVADFKEEQTIQTTRRVRVPGMRGRILDRNGKVLAECRPSRSIRCYLEHFLRRGATSNTVAAVDMALNKLSVTIGCERQLTSAQISRHVRTASAVPLTVLQDLDERTFARFCEHSHEFLGFEGFIEPERAYPYGELAAHVLGFTGRGDPEGDDDAPVYYSEKELRGRAGIEGFYNSYLSSVSGERRVFVDARGFSISKANRALIAAEAADGDVAPEDGLDLNLTLDVDIQLAVERELKGMTGAAVVLDPRDGAVLAMASAPTFNPNNCVPRLTPEVYATLTNAPAKCGQNRAISEAYAPGSTFKPITALAALSTAWMPDDEYDCCGVYRLGNLRLHCWDRYGHGPVNLRSAIEQSCNPFFCNIGTVIGSNAVIRACHEFGLGKVTEIDLSGETPGVVPDDAWKRRWYGEPWYPGDTCQMCIGQGMLLVTPLQMAMVAATIANGGKGYRPYIHARAEGTRAPDPVRTIPFSRDAINLVRHGMKDVVDTGTGRSILVRTEPNFTGGRWKRYRLNVDCAGKTGTAEIGRGATKRKNTWIIAFAPFENPTVAIAMIIERGESGGKTVAPRVHNVLAAVFGETEIQSGNGRIRSGIEERD